MKFKHVLVEKLLDPEWARTIIGGDRYYRLPDNSLVPSVTSFLSHIDVDGSKKAIEDWKKRVGENKAQRISTQAARRGHAIHDLSEKYLKNDPEYYKGHMPANIFTFKQIKPFLDENVNEINGLELGLYSSKLGLAGTCDFFGIIKKYKSILDFKTSRSGIYSKKKYCLQSTAYSLMCEDLYGVKIEKIFIAIVPDNGPPKIIDENPEDFKDELIHEIDHYNDHIRECIANGG